MGRGAMDESKNSFIPGTAPVGVRLTRTGGPVSKNRSNRGNSKDGDYGHNQNVFIKDNGDRIDENVEFIINTSGDTPAPNYYQEQGKGDSFLNIMATNKAQLNNALQ